MLTCRYHWSREESLKASVASCVALSWSHSASLAVCSLPLLPACLSRCDCFEDSACLTAVQSHTPVSHAELRTHAATHKKGLLTVAIVMGDQTQHSRTNALQCAGWQPVDDDVRAGRHTSIATCTKRVVVAFSGEESYMVPGCCRRRAA